ncbi:glycoside hydrolase family 13 protein [Paenibacillus sp. WLX2291]|uniref:glycoside hydrolase family 13 protein n=1 Tax=Paenibacillus sp. WLX2291 TaxID=3296934 RepID=UPI0039846152
MRPGWWKESVVYQIYPRSFQDSNSDGIGDLRGIIQRLDYIHALGADVIWLCPVYDSPNDDNGYDIRDYYRIHEEFGTMEEMEELITRAGEYGIRIIMDLVANHTSDEHAWFVESRSSLDNDKRDWYIWRPGQDGQTPNNWGSHFGGSAWEYDEVTGEYYLHCFSRKQPDLNWENPQVRSELYRMMEWWIQLGIAGFRIDAITFIKKDQHLLSPAINVVQQDEHAVTSIAQQELTTAQTNPTSTQANSTTTPAMIPVIAACLNRPGIMDFLQEMKREVLVPHQAMTVAEAPGVPIDDVDQYVDEDEGVFNMIFQFDHVDLDLNPEEQGMYQHWNLTDFKRVLSHWQEATSRNSWMALYLENHDHVRSVSKFAHDGQHREAAAKMLAAYYLLMRGTPFIYQGQELGMTNHRFDSIEDYRDLDSIRMYHEQRAAGRAEEDIMEYLYRRSRDQGRTPMQWNAEAGAGFTQGTPWLQINPNHTQINVEDQLANERSVLHFYRKLVQLRKQHPALIYGDYTPIQNDSEQIAAYIRSYKQEFWSVWCNFTDSTISLPEHRGDDIMLCNLEHHESGILQPFETVIFRSLRPD